MMQSRLGEGISWSWQTTGSRAAPLPVSLCERDIFPHPCCPTPPRVKGCRRAQQTSGRMRLATELANDAVNSQLARWPQGLESHPQKAFCPLAPSLVTRVFDVRRQCTSGGPMRRQRTSEDRCGALSAAQRDVRLLCQVVSREIGVLQENGCITPVGST